MRKPRAQRTILVVNSSGGERLVTRKKADFLREIGAAIFLTETSIRILKEEEARIQRREELAVYDDYSFWKEVTKQRGGNSLTCVQFTGRDQEGYTRTQIRMCVHG